MKHIFVINSHAMKLEHYQKLHFLARELFWVLFSPFIDNLNAATDVPNADVS
jgi:hypothetical protein